MDIFMKATGIVRRIDDLGRVVIPKEIRRVMRIREGDPLEIFTSGGGEVIFKKYSMVGELRESAEASAAALSKETALSVVICDRDGCIAAAGISKREALEKPVSSHLEYIMESRQSIKDKQEWQALEGISSPIAAASPIITGGDIAGCVALLSNDKQEKANETDFKLCCLSAKILEGKIE